ncbi:MAG: acylase, partial [Myxococcota bacterium]
AARGQLAAVNGREAAPNDYMVQLLRIWDAIDARYETELSPRTRALLEAYADGIGHYAALHPEQVQPGFTPVSGRDVVAGFSHKMPLFFGVGRVLGELVAEEDEGPRPPPRAAAAGSNAFAVAPSRSADGRTRLLVNSHQPWEGPVAWYEVHLHSEEGWDMVGGVFPGSPVVLHGHNRNLGWAHTVNAPDLIDVYALEVHPQDPERYRFDGVWRRVEVRPAPIRVKLLGPFYWTFQREVWWSLHGPVLRGPRGTHAIRYAGWGDLRIVEQWYRMNKARDFAEWKEAMGVAALPMFNTVYADRVGNIYYVYNARLPLRAEGYDWSSPVPGNTSETLWTDYLPFDELPQVEAPPSGFVQSCNSSPYQTTLGPGNPQPGDFAANLGIERKMTNRSLRALELLGSDESISAVEFERYKFDMAYSRGSDVGRLVEEILEAPVSEDPLVRDAVEVLRAWDLRTDPDNRSAAIGVLSIQPVLTATGPGGRRAEAPELMQSLARVARALLEAHGRIDVPWREVNRLRRGELDLGLGGGPDVLHAVYGGELRDGRVAGRAGDCYVLLVEWGPDGVSSRSIHQYGSATLDERSRHYADQAPLFVQRELKPVWMDLADIRAHLEREYRPGEEIVR